MFALNIIFTVSVSATFGIFGARVCESGVKVTEIRLAFVVSELDETNVLEGNIWCGCVWLKSQGLGIFIIVILEVNRLKVSAEIASEVSVVKISSVKNFNLVKVVDDKILRLIVKVSVLNPEVNAVLSVSNFPESVLLIHV